MVTCATDSLSSSERFLPDESCCNYNPQITRLLLNSDATVEVYSNSGYSPLMWSASDNISLGVLNLLLSGGANVEALDPWGNTILARASQFNSNPEIILKLIELSRDKSIENNFGQTALDLLYTNENINADSHFKKLEQLLR